jgi:hypothetical protein
MKKPEEHMPKTFNKFKEIIEGEEEKISEKLKKWKWLDE